MVEGLICIGLSLIVLSGFMLIPLLKKMKCSQVVDATITDIVDGTLVVNGKRMCSAKVKFNYKGLEYATVVDLNVNRYEIIIDNIIKIRINPSNPKETYIESKSMKGIRLFAVAICIPFMLVGIFLISDAMDVNWGDTRLENGALKDATKDYSDKKKEEIEEKTTINNNSQKSNEDSVEINSDKIGVNKYDKNITAQLRMSHNYIKIYNILQTEAKYNNLGANMSNEIIKGNIEYMKGSKLHKNIKDIMFYLPIHFVIKEQKNNDYFFEESVTKSRMRIFFATAKGTDVHSKVLLNDMSNYNRIFSDKVKTVVYNNNEFKMFKARNANGEYLDVVCSLNKKHILYIEYNHKIGEPNIINEFVTTIKY